MKALIVIDNLYTGGIATSLYNFLNSTASEVEYHLTVFNDNSIDYDKIPANVNIVKASNILHILGKNRHDLKKESKFKYLCKGVLTVICKFTNGRFARRLLWPFVKKSNEYDLAISYAQDDGWGSLSKGCNDYVLKKVKARHKATMVHCDYEHFGGYSPKQIKDYRKFDSILCVSESCRKSFVRCFPVLEEVCMTCENFTNIEHVKELAVPAIEYPHDSVNFVSVCRLGEEKGLERTVDAFKKVKDMGFENFTWTVVGGGPVYNNLVKKITEYGLGAKITLVGNKLNPYTYVKEASVFLLPSFHEAAPMVFGESAALGVPILTTQTCSAVEMVEDKGIGVVVDNSEEGIMTGIKDILSGNIDLSKYSISDECVNENARNQFEGFISLVKTNL